MIRWTDAFVNSLGGNAETGFACLQALVPPVKAIPGVLFGYSASRRLEKILRECAAAKGCDDAAVRSAIRFIVLLVEKNHFREIDTIMQKIEERLDAQKGILAVTAETAQPMDSAFQEELRQLIQDKTGAAKIKMNTRLVPDLLGGFKLRIGGYYIDASLKGQAEKMRAVLEEAILASSPGGGV